jgi:hypothetical protein
MNTLKMTISLRWENFQCYFSAFTVECFTFKKWKTFSCSQEEVIEIWGKIWEKREIRTWNIGHQIIFIGVFDSDKFKVDVILA